MSAVKRFISGGAAGIVSIFVVVLNQLALVPIFLAHWSVEEFGVWLTVQALMSFSSVLSFGYKTYWEFEFLKLGSGDRLATAQSLYSAIPTVLFLATLETVVVWVIVQSGAVSTLLSSNGVSASLVSDAGWLWLVQSFNWLLFIATPGLAQRAIVPYGYYPRNAWWYVAGSFFSTIAAAIAVLMGAKLLLAGVIQAMVYAVFALVLCWNLRAILRKESILPVRPCYGLGFYAIWPSLALAAKSLLGMIQQHGIRVLLAGGLGVRDLAAFSTMRTVSNVALQGVGTVVNPITPELMRFAVACDSERVRASMGVIWLIGVYVMGVFLLMLQIMAPWLFDLWTLGKIAFDPLVFAVLSIALLIFGLSQPVLTLVRGNNLLKAQLIVTVFGAVVMVGSIFLLTRKFGMLAAAFGLLSAEIISLAIYAWTAKRWLISKGINWPKDLAVHALIMVFASVIAILAIAFLPRTNLAVISFAFLLQIWMSKRYWDELPKIIHERVSKFLAILLKIK